MRKVKQPKVTVLKSHDTSLLQPFWRRCPGGWRRGTSTSWGICLWPFDAMEGSFGVEHAGRGPAQHHLAVAPAGAVTVGRSGYRDHRLDGVTGDEGFGQAPIVSRATVNTSSRLSRSDTHGLGQFPSCCAARLFASRSLYWGSGSPNALTCLASTQSLSLPARGQQHFPACSACIILNPGFVAQHLAHSPR